MILRASALQTARLPNCMFVLSPACGIASDLASVSCSLVEWLVVSHRGVRERDVCGITSSC